MDRALEWSEARAHDILHHTELVSTRWVVCERYLSFLNSLPFSLPSHARTYTHKCTTELRQKSTKSIDDRRNPEKTGNTHLKISISTVAVFLLCCLFCPFRCLVLAFRLWVPIWRFSRLVFCRMCPPPSHHLWLWSSLIIRYCWVFSVLYEYPHMVWIL